MNPESIKTAIAGVAPLVIAFGGKVIAVLLLLWIGLRIAGKIGQRVTKTLEKRDFDKSLSRFFGQLARWGIVLGVVLACLSVFGIDTTSFAAVIGAAGLAIGLAFQGTLGNFSAGVMLLVFRPFKVGDVVKVADVLGVINEIGLFTCAFDTLDNRRIIVPNSAVAGGTIENISFHDKRRVDIDVGASYDADIPATREKLEAAVKAVESKLDDEKHQVFLKGLGGSSVDWQLRIWCKASDYWAVWEQTIEAIKAELDGAEIGIPYPQMDVYLKELPANQAVKVPAE
ncbi:MAG: mechanosensitive ion channel domain-containing protein [Myxococcota bacterium]